jgi:hypothetical protein
MRTAHPAALLATAAGFQTTYNRSEVTVMQWHFFFVMAHHFALKNGLLETSCRDISCCPTGNIPTMFYLSGHFPLPNRKCPDSQKVSEHFLMGCRDISCCPIGNIPTRKSVGTFPIGVVGTFLVGCVGTSTGSVSGHFYCPVLA